MTMGYTGAKEVILLFLLFIAAILAFVIAFGRSKRLKVDEIELIKYDRQRYKRVRWIFNEQYSVRGCPVAFLRGAVLRDSVTEKELLQLKFTNTGGKAIKSAYIAVDFIDDAGEMAADGSTIQVEYLDVNCADGDYFGAKKLIELNGIGATHIIVTYRKVVFADGTVWKADTSEQALRASGITLLKDILPPELQDEVSDNIVCKPEMLDDKLWRCACGCLAGDQDRDVCPNCHQTFAQAQEAAGISALETKRKLQNKSRK